MDLETANRLRFNFEPIERVLFGLNDSVKVKSGEHKDKTASVISPVSLEPITYFIELDGAFGGDVIIAQTELEIEK